MDSSLPTDQEFLLLTVEGLNAVIKDVGGERSVVREPCVREAIEDGPDRFHSR